MKGQIGQLMQQAQRMQEDMKRAQDEIAQMEVTGQSGGGLVSVRMSGVEYEPPGAAPRVLLRRRGT